MFVSSPYPWHYTLRWPFYFLWPSQYNHTKLKITHDSKQFQDNDHHDIRLLFCGDIMTLNHDIIPTLHPKLCALIHSADYFIGNCEAVVGHHQLNKNAKYRFIFHMPRDYLENIIQQTKLPASRWLLSIANNHIGDISSHAFRETNDILKNIGVQPLGEFNKNNFPLHIIEENHLRIGFLAWTEWLNRDIFYDDDPGVNRHQHVFSYDWQKIKSLLNLDYIFGLPHWEYEFQHFPCIKTRQSAEKLINNLGIDFIIGSHTHTLQSIELFENGLCAYNLGNFAGQGKAWSVKLNTLLEVKLKAHSIHPLVSYKLHYFFQEHINNQINIIPLNEAPERKKNQLLKLINKLYLTQG